MIRLDVTQGSPEWVEARLGIPTSSRFSDIMTPTTRKYSKSSSRYRYELLAEWMLGYPLDGGSSEWMMRGSVMEQQARTYYEFQRDVDVTPGGLVLRDDGRVGCSPDGLVGDVGGLEMKCPTALYHMSYLLGEEPKHMAQVQGCIWLCERDWWDLLAFNPAFPPGLVRINRDDKFIADLESAVGRFLDELDDSKRKLEAIRAGETDDLGELLRRSVA